MGQEINHTENVIAVNDTLFACLLGNVLVWELQAVHGQTDEVLMGLFM